MSLKLLNNVLFAVQLQLVAEADRVGAAFGVSSEIVRSGLSMSSGGSQALTKAEAYESAAEFGAVAAKYMNKDTAAARSLAAANGISLDLFDEVIRRGPLRLVDPK